MNAIIGHTISFRGALEMGLKTLSDGIIAIAIFSLLALTNGIALSLLVIILGVLVSDTIGCFAVGLRNMDDSLIIMLLVLFRELMRALKDLKKFAF